MDARPAVGDHQQSPPDIVESDIPARLDRLPWGRFHTLVVVALGVTWILDGLEVTLAGAMAGALKGGQGSASIITQDGFTIAALACVNCWGSTTLPGQRAFWAHAFEIDGEFGAVAPVLNKRFDAEEWGGAKFSAQPRANTTLAIVAVDADLTPAEARRVAQMASAGSTPIRPIRMTMTMGTRAKTEPTERSNSPEIIRMPVPSARMPSSGTAKSTTRVLPNETNCGA